MDWDEHLALLQTGGPGLAAIAGRARGGARDGHLTGTRVLYDPDEIAALAHALQDRCARAAATLFAGVERAERLGREQRARFGLLASRGVTAVLYGVGVPERLPPAVHWVEVPPRSSALENQWFLAAERPGPVVLIRVLIAASPGASPARPCDRGGDAAAFFTTDDRLVGGIVTVLRAVAARGGLELRP